MVFFGPEMGGYFLEANNFIPANPMSTPQHIAPVWYFTPYYSILRANTINFLWIDAKVWGVVFMGLGVLSFFFLPWLDRSPVRSIRYRGLLYKGALSIFVVCFLILGYLGLLPPTEGRTRSVRDLPLEDGSVLTLPTIGLELGFAGATRADATTRTRKVCPQLCEAGQLVFKLRELNLKAAFTGACVQGKDVQNESATVNDLYAKHLFEATLLCW